MPQTVSFIIPPPTATNESLLRLSQTRLDTWFERDRAHVHLTDLRGNTIIEWWDDEVHAAIEDGFLDPRDYHRSAFEYARDLKLV